MNYEVEPDNIGSLMRNFPGLYSETLIQNNTYENVVCIDSHGNKSIIPPMSFNQFGREQIVVWCRRSAKPTVDQNNYPQDAPGFRVLIPKHELTKEGGIYVKEIDLVLCSESASVTAAHPFGSVTYSDAASEASQTLMEAFNGAPTIRITANDPENRYTKLYTVCGDIPVDIDVTHVFGEAELRISYIYNSHEKVYEVPLDDFFNSADDYLDLTDLPIAFITTNRMKAKLHASEAKRIPQSEVDELLKKAAAKTAKEVLATKDQYETEIKLKESENKRLAESLKVAEDTVKASEQKYKELSAAVEASATIRERELKSAEISNKARISDNNRDISDNDVRTSTAKRNSAEKEEKYKLAHIIIAAAVPTIGALAIKGIESYMKASASKQCIGTSAFNFIKFL